MGTTRDLVLKNLLEKQKLTINELAEAVNINPISVRHHISKLEASGLVSSEEERHGVGRPRRIYFLTQNGREKFPSRYIQLSSRLVEKLKDTLAPEVLAGIFTDMASEIISFHVDPNILNSLDIEERVGLAKRILEEEGFVVELEKTEQGYLLKETSCPFSHISLEHKEICQLDRTIIATVLDVPVEESHCLREGDDYCSYFAAVITPQEIQVMEKQ
ncbi:MAG: ArsR family transcriptional regulator [Anaerolineae bacterium]|nr:ArsR family transcriptional regulator [Anaerolineae bacterium]